MPSTWREQRHSELNGLKNTDPAKLLSMYCGVAGLAVDNQFPRNASFASMIAAILDSEENARRADDQRSQNLNTATKSPA